jgi:hypothetical protein
MFEWVQWNNPVAIWWSFLVAASVLNICIWFWLRFYRFSGENIASLFNFRNHPKSIIWFSAFYVFVCAFRSILPRADVQRICLFDTWLSSVFVGRFVATIAELAFIAQWSIIFGLIGLALRDRWIQRFSKIILFTILTAECFSWYAVISTHYLGNSVEESLWGLTYLGISVVTLRTWFKLKGPMRLAAGFSFVGNILYVAFMFTVDVPMYLTRLKQDNLSDKKLLGLVDGLTDLWSHWHVTYSIQDWKTEIPWMTLYFTFAVLVSLALCLLPLSEAGWKKHLKNQD